ncbi:hypothetical protein [Jatrophihabitans sp.]|jgi:hypothetical protein|uniref:P-loop NTPase n=1 Tax=Jatrophihabitans sp. TaxID=1932789 RepID=UPI002F127CF6
MGQHQEQRGEEGSTNFQALGDLYVGMDPQEVRRLVQELVDDRLSRTSGPPTPLPGWVRITREYLAARKPRADLEDYFDGAAPDWQDTCHPLLLPRPAVTKAIEAFRADILEDRSLLLRIGGASGDGKSTALMQATQALAHEGHFDAIYWRRSAQARFTPDVVATMCGQRQKILIASDNAEQLLEDIDVFAGMKLQEEDFFFHFLLASRDVDWNAERDRLRWKLSPAGRWAASFRVLPPLALGRVERPDAQVIAQNWLNCSSSRPGLVVSGNVQQVSQAMLDASRSSEGRQAFMGGVLSMRFAPERLRLRLTSLLSTVESMHPGDPDTSLADFLAVLAAVDVGGGDGVPRDIAARFLMIPESELRPSVEVPLKREFFLASSSQAFFARHPNISRALLELVLDDESSLQVESSLEKFLRDVHYVGKQAGFRPGFGKLIDLGRRLINSDFPRNLVGPLALHLCRTACTVASGELSTHIALSQALRELGRPQSALGEVWEIQAARLDDPALWGDYDDHVRGAWSEMSVALGTSGNRRSAYWAAQVSISDRMSTGLAPTQVLLALNQLALGAKVICESGGDRAEFRNLLTEVQALTSMAKSPFYDNKQYPTRYLQQLEIAPRQFSGADELIAVIRRAADALSASAHPLLSWCDRLADPHDYSFTTLRSLLVQGVR